MLHPQKAADGRLVARSLRRFMGAGALIASLATVAISTAVIEGIGTIADAFDKGQLIKSANLTPAQAGAAQTIMIIGSDKRSESKDSYDRDDPPHSDTILLLRLDPAAGDVTELSVPRDLWVPQFSFQGSLWSNYKINAAYTIGSEYGHSATAADDLALKVVRQALDGIQINDIIDLNFLSFEQVVAKLGCVYVDVDHYYYHQNYAGEPASENYESINLRPGYKPLCGGVALAYVRYRHDDSTFARDARQQDFLREAKAQLGITGLLNHYKPILDALGKSISTNIHSSTAVARLIYLAFQTVDGPVREVQFPDNPAIEVDQGGVTQSDQTATPEQIREVVAQFENTAKAPPGLPTSNTTTTSPASSSGGSSTHHHHRTRHASRYSVPTTGLTPTTSTMTLAADQFAPQVPFKLEMPALISDYASQVSVPYDYYVYRMVDLQHHQHWAYHVTWQDTKELGAYYGIEGTTWTDPPLFANADTVTHGGRSYLEVGNGSHIQDIGWIDNGILYWVNNTLFDDLTNDQMVAIAESARSGA